MARKRSTALTILDMSQPAADKRRPGRPPKKRTTEPIIPIPEVNEDVAEDLNETLLTLYPVRHSRRQPTPVIPLVVEPPETEPFLIMKLL